MNVKTKDKVFRDSVHGYISIPNSYCYHFIDTPEFQRLRRIEQTSIRVLFPSARHDRFIHSIGVFHLGTLALSYIERNSRELLKELKDEWEGIKVTFQIACLLHDIGHTPFSHTFEKNLDRPACLDEILSDLAKKREKKFVRDIPKTGVNPHEMSSGIIILRRFAETMEKEFNAEPVLAVRMVIGARYRGELSFKEEVANCLIDLLNGRIIDVDKLDYVNRDAWASGYSPGSVDIKRLLSSLSMKYSNSSAENPTLKLVFHKNALSQIDRVITAKNFQKYWLITHHKVVYNQHLLKKSVEQLARLLIKGEQPLSSFFNVDDFLTPRQIGNYTIYLPTDDDIIFLLKAHIDSIPCAKEFLYRKHILKPLWKTYAEFYSLFGRDIRGENIERNGELHRLVHRDSVKEHIGAASKDEYEVLDVDPKISYIKKGNIYVDLNDKISCYTDLKLPFKPSEQPKPFFLLFVTEELLKNKNDIVKKLISYAS